MFDLYEMLEYLLKKAYKRERISYMNLFSAFGVNPSDSIEKANFFNHLENVDRRIVDEVKNNNLVPVYTTIFYSTVNNLPNSGFYDVFMNRNRNKFNSIRATSDNFEYDIFSNSMEILEDDLLNRFPDEDSINNFIAEVIMYRDIEIPNVLE